MPGAEFLYRVLFFLFIQLSLIFAKKRVYYNLGKYNFYIRREPL